MSLKPPFLPYISALFSVLNVWAQTLATGVRTALTMTTSSAELTKSLARPREGRASATFWMVCAIVLATICVGVLETLSGDEEKDTSRGLQSSF